MLREPHATKGSGVTPSRVRYRRAMDPKKPWDGYVSFSYLQPGTDFTVFELDEQVGRIQPFTYPLDIHQAERADRLLRSCVCISLHDHAGVSPKDWNRFDAYVREGREWYGFEGLAASGLDAVLENFLDGTSTITSKSGWKWTDVIHDIGMRFADVAHQSVVFVGSTVDDIVQAHASGRIALIPCLEGAAPIENELDRLDVLFGLGVRMLGITYSESNALGGGLKDPGDAGLTRFGRDAVRRMNRLGMAIDLSHVGDVTAMDTCGSSERPVFLSHSGARALFPERKLKSDDLLAAVADTGGVIGIEAAPHTTISPDHPRHSLESVMDHVEYCIDLVGIDHVGLGPDTFFGDHVALHRFYSAAFDTGEVPGFEEVDHVEGLENPSEFPNVIRWLVGHGYDDEQIGKIVGGNALRALREVWV